MDYNLIAPFYSELVTDKNLYLDGVDAFLVSSLLGHEVGNYLDIGCGDGVRTTNLHKKLSCGSTEGVDLSIRMIDKARASYHGLHGVSFYQINGIKDISGEPRDLVTMLWNVIGHVPEESRLQFLKDIRRKIKKDGLLFLDVNNYYYYRYGRLRVVYRVIKDKILSPHSFESGDLFFRMKLGGREIECTGHIFRPLEIFNLLKKSGFSIEKVNYIDYQSGRSSSRFWSGQISILCRNS